jgi:RluA family pseudouridine synthase
MNFALPEILYQDQNLLIIDKNPGLLSIPDGYDPTLPHLRLLLEPIYGKLWMVHRLDKETSGVMVMARNADAHRKLNGEFKNRNVEKIYHCLVYPTPSWRSMDIKLPLIINADRQHRTRVNQKMGKPARSLCRVIKQFKSGCLLEINIFSGVTHQIRAHLREYDLVILGDQLYGAGLGSPPIEVPRMMLHARRLAFFHPATTEEVQFVANYPDDFRQAYTKLKRPRAQDEAF